MYSHNRFSESARDLSAALGVRRIKHEGSTYRARPGKTVINWGSSKLPENVAGASIINRPTAVGLAANKLQCFTVLEGAEVRIPEFTDDVDVAVSWLDEGATVVARATVNGHGGEGITLCEPNGVDIPDAPLYTKYVPKKEEWRIHVVRGDIIDFARKIRNPEVADADVNWKVRNHANGFIFAREVDPPAEDIKAQALAAVEALGLDFGAVDVIWNQQQQRAYVLEVNTAPGLTGTTLERYTEAFRGFV